MSKRKACYPPKRAPSPSPWNTNARVPARNLREEDLGGVIFGCKNHTINECLDKMLFGLPHWHFSYVKKVTPGLALFLFNYSDRTLHGIFEATSSGEMDIDPKAWTAKYGSSTTPFSAQVRVKAFKQCRPLREEEFAPAIANNYYGDDFFLFELDNEQAFDLTKLFLSSSRVPKKTLQVLDVRCDSSLIIEDRYVPSVEEDELLEEFMVAKADVEILETEEKERQGSALTEEENWNLGLIMEDRYVPPVEDDETFSEFMDTKAAREAAVVKSEEKASVVHVDPVIKKLMREIEGLTAFQMDQQLKINYLQHQLGFANNPYYTQLRSYGPPVEIVNHERGYGFNQYQDLDLPRWNSYYY